MPEPDETRVEAMKRLDERAAALEARTTRPSRDYGSKAAGYGYRLLGLLLGGVFVGVGFGAGVDVVAWRDERERLCVGPRSCPHLGADLATGTVHRGALICRWHGLTLDGHTCELGWNPLPSHDDGVLAWVPGLGPVYSIGAGAFLVGQALRAGASVSTVTRMIAYLAADTASSGVPFVGWAVDTLFPGHLMAATALQKDIEDRHGAPPEIPLKQRTRKPRKARR